MLSALQFALQVTLHCGYFELCHVTESHSGYFLPARHGCMVFMRANSHTYSKGHMRGTAGGWREESSLHMRVLHVQLSLNHRRSPSWLSLFFLYPCCPSVPTVFLPPLCPAILLPFISPSSLAHSWPTVRILSCFPAGSQSSPVIPSSQLCLSGMNLRWHWYNPLKCKGAWEQV